MKGLNIWVIGRNYPQQSNGMQGSFELEQAKLLGKHYDKVSYLSCSLRPANLIKRKQYQAWEEEGISIYTYTDFFWPRIYPFYAIKCRNRIWHLFLKRVQENTGMPDVIHVHYPAMLLLAEVLKDYHEKGIKIFVTEHWSKVLTESLNRKEMEHYRKYLEYVDEWICVGKSLADSISNIAGNNKLSITVIPNIVSQKFKPSITKHNGFKFIAIGRLVKIKQFDKIILAFTKCFRNQDVVLEIVGDGEEYKSLKKLIIKLHMDKQIILTGYLCKDLVVQKLMNADCLICYSQVETFGVPVVEAWLTGIPTIVSSGASVAADYFDKKLGIEVSPNDTKKLMQAMKHIYSNIGDYDKNYLSTYAKANFSEEVVNKKLMNIYQTYE